MDQIHFSYEITKQDYVDANKLIWSKLKWRRSWLVLLLGLAVIAVPFLHTDADGYANVDHTLLWPMLLLGVFLIYCGLRYQSLKHRAGEAYSSTGIGNHKFEALISKEGIEVKGTYSEWKYAWPAMLLVEESEELFTFYTGLQIFIFAKRYLTSEQSEAIRQLIAAQPKFPGGTIPKY
jgi:hypothetical protein